MKVSFPPLKPLCPSAQPPADMDSFDHRHPSPTRHLHLLCHRATRATRVITQILSLGFHRNRSHRSCSPPFCGPRYRCALAGQDPVPRRTRNVVCWTHRNLRAHIWIALCVLSPHRQVDLADSPAQAYIRAQAQATRGKAHPHHSSADTDRRSTASIDVPSAILRSWALSGSHVVRQSWSSIRSQHMEGTGKPKFVRSLLLPPAVGRAALGRLSVPRPHLACIH